jgi:hypothetical protein
MRNASRILAVLLFAAALPAEIIDQIAVSLDNEVITRSQVLEEARVTAFLNGEKPDLGATNLRKTADRLIEQILVLREMDLTRFPKPSAAEVDAAFKQVKDRFPGAEQLRQALESAGVTEAQVRSALDRQLTLLRFVELRFRPEVQVQESEAKQYYETVFLPEVRKKGIKPEPDFEEVRDQCEEALAAQLVDKRLDAWLADTRSRSRIAYIEEAFQ